MFRNVVLQTIAAGLALILAAGTAVAQEAEGPSLSQIVEGWLSSAHNDRTAEAFRHWDDEEAGEIPGSCAVCHSSIGVIDFARSERAAAGVIDHPVPIGSTVDCAACHNAAVPDLSPVLFPSGATSEVFGASAICATCHQGRASSVQVMAATEGMDEDAVSEELGFINVHYKAAAATQLGAGVHGGFEYPGKTYMGQFGHVPDFDTCTECHSPHRLEVSLESCTTCHKGAESFEDIRTATVDYDGDADVTEGIAHEIETLRDALGVAIATYAAEVPEAPVIYAAANYPYFFNDSDADGMVGEGEAAYPNRYQSWTPRMLKAAYNYQYALKDTGAYAHNPRYVMQILYDSLEDLGTQVTVDMAGMTRP
jgi:hypothetical protein